MEAAGLAMLGLVIIGLIATGLPAFAVLIGVSVAFAALGVATGSLPFRLLTALPSRIAGLMETDLLQALPLYVLMGALLDRLPLADILFRAGAAALSHSGAAPLLSALGVGAMLARSAPARRRCRAYCSRGWRPAGFRPAKACRSCASPARSASSCRPRWC